MAKVDFTKTPEQVRSEIEDEIEGLHRQLMVSQGHGEKGTSMLLNGLLALIVLVGQFLFSLFFEQHDPVTAPLAAATHVSPRDKELLNTQLRRIEDGIEIISATKSRVAPSMPIDAHIATINSAAKDVRALLAPIPTSSSQQSPAIPLPVNAASR
jgi:hypothetical protein